MTTKNRLAATKKSKYGAVCEPVDDDRMVEIRYGDLSMLYSATEARKDMYQAQANGVEHSAFCSAVAECDQEEAHNMVIMLSLSLDSAQEALEKARKPRS